MKTEKQSNQNNLCLLDSWYSGLSSVLLVDSYIILSRRDFSAVPDCRGPSLLIREVRTNPKDGEPVVTTDQRVLSSALR